MGAIVNDERARIHELGRLGEHRLAQDLFDALWLEDAFGFRERAAWRGDALVVPLDATRVLAWRGRRVEGWRALRLARDAAVAIEGDAASATPLDVVQTLDALQGATWWPARAPALDALLRAARGQIERSLAAESALLARLRAAPHALLPWDALCCLRDRPFHPLARAKLWPGLPGADFDVESGRPIAWRWLAVPVSRLRAGAVADGDQPCARALLDPAELAELARRAQLAGASPRACWLPVHPWQYAHLRRDHAALLDGCVDLGEGPGAGAPTASLRSLATARAPLLHLKLSLGVQALGAERVLPPRYLHNGARAQACLQALRERDPWLGAHLEPCDERAWWALSEVDAMPDEASLIAERGRLACLLRRYPAGEGWLLPMAALSVTTSDGRLPAFDALCGGAGHATPARRRERFGQVVRCLVELGLRCLRHGVMPELHGQNVVLRIVHAAPDTATVAAVVLRDHDTLRICPSRMAEVGLPPPCYAIDRGTPNTLVLDTPDRLLAYFQTLAVGVNLYAIAAALADAPDAEAADHEAGAWRRIGVALREAVARVFADEASSALRRQVEAALFERKHWPFKQLLEPLAARAAVGTGMPSGLGRIANPLRMAGLDARRLA